MDNDADLIARMRFQLQREGLKSAVRGALSDGADRLSALAAERDKLRKLDEEAATHVETVICMRTGFTGEPPYVGWKGLGLALTEALDERDALRAELECIARRLEAIDAPKFVIPLHYFQACSDAGVPITWVVDEEKPTLTTKTPGRVIAEAIFNDNVGGTSDPDLLALAEGVAEQTARNAIAALSAAGFVIHDTRTHVAVDKAALWDLSVATKKVTHGHVSAAAEEKPDAA